MLETRYWGTCISKEISFQWWTDARPTFKRKRLICIEIQTSRQHTLCIEARTRRRLKRRTYNVKGPNHLWHIDTNHKLIIWCMIIFASIDGFSRLPVSLECIDNSKARTILWCFLKGVNTHGMPSRERSDQGRENVSAANFMTENRGARRGSMFTVKSTHKQPIERLWRKVFMGVIALYY